MLINFKKVYDTGVLYQMKSEEVTKIKNSLTEISKRIKNEWEGPDAHNFLESFNAHIYSLNNIINYLDGNETIFKDTAIEQSGSHDKFVGSMERSDDDGVKV